MARAALTFLRGKPNQLEEAGAIKQAPCDSDASDHLGLNVTLEHLTDQWLAAKKRFRFLMVQASYEEKRLKHNVTKNFRKDRKDRK